MPLGDTSHRPFPPPHRPWAVAMTWHDLLFMHWPVPAAALRTLVPAGLEIDTFTGPGPDAHPWNDQAWIGVVPFRMTGIRHRLAPPIPWLSAFPELNVRTYVRGTSGPPGVWFFSLDATSRVAIAVARAAYHLNYLHARMRLRQSPAERGDWIEYTSERRAAPAAVFRGRYRPIGETFRAAPRSLEHFLTERYCLYAADRRGRLLRADIHHQPWPLHRAEALVEINTMAAPLGLDLPPADAPAGIPLLHFARLLDVVAWTPRTA